MYDPSITVFTEEGTTVSFDANDERVTVTGSGTIGPWACKEIGAFLIERGTKFEPEWEFDQAVRKIRERDDRLTALTEDR